LQELDNRKITSTKIFYRNSKSFDEDGIFSERVFGPVRDYKCKCGKLNNQILDDGKRCDKCKVLCTSSESRLENYGIIPLPFACIKPNKFKQIKEVVLNINDYVKTLFNPIRSDYNITQSRYVGVNRSNLEIRIFNDKSNLDYIYIPLRVTGIYSFILCLRYIAAKFNFQNVKDLFDNQTFMTQLKVLPPGVRPVNFTRGDNTKIQLSEINTVYISLLNLNKSNILIADNLKIDEDDWFDRISLYFEGDYDNSDEEIVEHAIIEYDITTSRYQYYINLVYSVLTSTISGKEGFIRNNMLGKTIEFSARSVICCDPSLEVYQIGVSKKILYKLWMLYFLHYLIEVKERDSVWCIDGIANRDYEDNKELFDEFLRWFYNDKD
jgi:DNA-directed RNA polymerase beta' subunit